MMKEIDQYQNPTHYTSIMNSLTKEIESLVTKKHYLLIREKNIKKSMCGVKFYIDNTAQILESISETNKKDPDYSESILKSKIITILGENLLLLQDVANMDDSELEEKMLSDEFTLFISCKIQEIDHVGLYHRNSMIQSRLGISSDGPSSINNQEGKGLPPIKHKSKITVITNLKIDYSDQGLSNGLPVSLSSLNKKSNFSVNFGKFHLKKSANAIPRGIHSKFNPQYSRNILSKYEYLQKKEMSADKRLSPNSGSVASYRKIKLKPLSDSESMKIKFSSPMRIGEFNSAGDFINLEEQIEREIQDNLKADYYYTSEEEFNLLKQRETSLMQLHEKMFKTESDNSRMFEKKLIDITASNELTNKKLELIKKENSLYLKELEDLYAILRINVEEKKIFTRNQATNDSKINYSEAKQNQKQ